MADVMHLGARRLKIDPDPAKSFTLPGWAYTDPSIYEAEKREIFYKTWQYAGALAELSNPGDYVTAKILDQNVIVIRDKEGQLRGFHNVCQHRAHELLKGRGCARVITCPYHAWSFHADGRLRSARGAEKMADFPMEAFSLKPVRVEVFAKHFVFFNLDLKATPLNDLAGDLAKEIAAEVVRFDDLVPETLAWESDVKANWKVVVDNFLECYHCRPAHPAFADLVDMPGYKVEARGLWSSQKGGIGRLDNRAYKVSPDAAVKDSRFWWLWPSTSFNMMPGEPSLGVFCMNPDGLDKTRQWGQILRLPGAKAEPDKAAYGQNVLMPEDNAICESVQRGLQSLGYDAGRFIYDPSGSEQNEAAVHHFHRLVADALGLLEGA